MCAIAGIYQHASNIPEKKIRQMCSRMVMRGPDSEGYYLHKRVALGHRRLSIIDLNTGDQPMFDNSNKIVIVLNGEIYNFRELRSELSQLGASFFSQSDTEVVLEAYKAWGIEQTLDRLEGMFAFALFDTEHEELFVCRDKFGEKPLYYEQNADGLRFASELKAFEPNLKKYSLDIIALNYFLALTYIPAPYTIYKEIRKLEAGHYLVINKSGQIKKVRYFDIRERLKSLGNITDFNQAKNKVLELVTESIKRKMIADVPLGVFLSGGIDSSIVAAVASKLSEKPVKTFTIGFKEKDYDESQRAQLVAHYIKSDHTVYYLDYKDAIPQLSEIILHFDEPYGDSSAIPSFFVSQLASQSVKVVLTGDCADELFCGYEKYLGRFYSEKFEKLPKWLQVIISKSVKTFPHNHHTNEWLRKFKKVIENKNLNDFDLHYNLMCLGFGDADRIKLLKNGLFVDIKPEIETIYKSFDLKDPIEKSQATDIKIVLEGDMFVKVDRMCMKNSLESRASFIDTKILDLAFSIPPTFKINGFNKKYILKEAFKEILPEKTLNYRKKGFGVPLDYWFKNELKQELENLLSKEIIEKQGIFNCDIIKRLLNEHMVGSENHKSKLWNLYVFQKWYFNHYNL